jgi:hypothetical protein
MPKCIVIDEGFGCVDAQNMELIMDALPELMEGLEFSIIISHIDLLVQSIPTIIPITYNGSLSIIRHGHSMDRREVSYVASDDRQMTAAMTPITDTTKKPIGRSRISSDDLPNGISRLDDGRYACSVCNSQFLQWKRHVITALHMKNTAK